MVDRRSRKRYKGAGYLLGGYVEDNNRRDKRQKTPVRLLIQPREERFTVQVARDMAGGCGSLPSIQAPSISNDNGIEQILILGGHIELSPGSVELVARKKQDFPIRESWNNE